MVESTPESGQRRFVLVFEREVSLQDFELLFSVSKFSSLRFSLPLVPRLLQPAP